MVGTARFALLMVTFCALAACGGQGTGADSGASSSPTTTSSSTVVGSVTTSSVKLTLSGTPAASIAVGSAYSFRPTATESSGTVSFSITGAPGWATFDTATGALSGTPTTADEGTTGPITIMASDAGSMASIGPFTIDVTSPATVGAATLSWAAPTENTNGTPLTDLAGYTIYYGSQMGALTQSIQVPSAATSYVIGNLAAGTYYFEIIAYSSEGIQSAPSNVVSLTI